MKAVGGVVCAAGLCVAFVVAGRAQDRSADPRVGLKAGLRDAGQAARNLELVASVAKPEGFFDPKNPGGIPTPPERSGGPGGATGASPAAGNPEARPASDAPSAGAPASPEGTTPAAQQQRGAGLNFSNSDLAFQRDYLFLGNFNGFNSYVIENPKRPTLRASIVCPGGQGDMSVHGNLLFMSVEQTRGRIDCGTQGVPEPVSADRFRGVRIFDISDVTKPRQVVAVQTCRGSHTHTLVVDPNDKANVYIYGSGTSAVRSGDELAGCSGKDPKEDPNTSLYSIDVIQVPLAAPEKAHIVNRPRIFADPATGAIAGLWPGGAHGEGTQRSSVTNQCHDITVFPEIGLAAGACSGNGILLDISDPVHPVRLDQVTDKNFAYWHSATFNNDGTKVIFTDEWGGGTRPRCRSTDPPNWGADAIFDIVDRKLQFRGYYKMPAPQTEQENCVAHNGSLIPVPGRDIMVQAWYQGGVSVFDFTDSSKPVEIAFFDRGPIDATQLITGGYWSTYWYNGRIYGSEIARGMDVFRLMPSEYLSQNEIAAALLVRTGELNVQAQTRAAWPASPVVGRAYLDQLTRDKGLSTDRAGAVKSALDHGDHKKREAVARQLEQDAGSAADVHDAVRMRALASLIRALR